MTGDTYKRPCPECGNSNSAAANYCQWCGAELVTQ